MNKEKYIVHIMPLPGEYTSAYFKRRREILLEMFEIGKIEKKIWDDALHNSIIEIDAETVSYFSLKYNLKFLQYEIST